MFGSLATSSTVGYIPRPAAAVPSNASGGRRLLEVRPGMVLRLNVATLPSGVRVLVTLRFAIWNRNSFEEAMAPVTQELVAATPMWVRPLPGFCHLELTIDPTGTDSESVSVTVDEEVPPGAANPGLWTLLELDQLATAAGVRFVDKLQAAFLAEFGIERSDTGLFRSTKKWIGAELEPKTISGKAYVGFRGVDYKVQYVMPSDPLATNTSNDGNSASLPRKTIDLTGSTPVYLVLESDFLFTSDNGWMGQSFGKNAIVVSSRPGRPAFVSNFKLRSTNFSSDWSGSAPYEMTESTYNGGGTNLTMPGAVVYSPLVRYTDPDTSNLTPYRPWVAPFTAQAAPRPLNHLGHWPSIQGRIRKLGATGKSPCQSWRCCQDRT